MPAIGYVQRQNDGAFTGKLQTLSVNVDIQITPNRGKVGDQPDYKVRAGTVDVGGGWIRTGEVSCREYIRLTFAHPDLFGGRPLYANLGRAAGQDDDDAFAIIWNPGDCADPPRAGPPVRGFFREGGCLFPEIWGSIRHRRHRVKDDGAPPFCCAKSLPPSPLRGRFAVPDPAPAAPGRTAFSSEERRRKCRWKPRSKSCARS